MFHYPIASCGFPVKIDEVIKCFAIELSSAGAQNIEYLARLG